MKLSQELDKLFQSYTYLDFSIRLLKPIEIENYKIHSLRKDMKEMRLRLKAIIEEKECQEK